jgi:uncharacterized protein (TIGR02611 family)
MLARMSATDVLRGLRARVHSLPGGRVAWRVAATGLGVAVVVIGIALLPLPGPGWVIIFAGLGILATEYAWAAALLQRARRAVTRWTAWVSGRRRGTAVVGAVLGIGVATGALWWLGS